MCGLKDVIELQLLASLLLTMIVGSAGSCESAASTRPTVQIGRVSSLYQGMLGLKRRSLSVPQSPI